MDDSVIRVVFLVAGLASLGLWLRSKSRDDSPRARVLDSDVEFPPKPAWKPNIPVDISRTVQTFAYYTDHKNAFVIFANGTCILLPEGSEDPEKDAKEILNKVYYYHGDFKSDLMDDRHFLITYSQPAYSIVFKDEVERYADYIEQNHLDGLIKAEVLLNAKGERDKFDDHGKIGLFGRARMYMDAQSPVIAQIWRPQA